MSEPSMLLMLGISFLIIAGIAKKIVKTPGTSLVTLKRPARDLKLIRQYIQNEEVLDING